MDCADPGLLAEFWMLALGYRRAGPPAGFDSWEQWLRSCDVPEDEWNDGAVIEDPAGVLPKIGFLKVPEGKTAKNRWHPDLQISGGRAQPAAARAQRIETSAAVLRGAGASELRRGDVSGRPDGELDHIVMTDPEGNEFCLV